MAKSPLTFARSIYRLATAVACVAFIFCFEGHIRTVTAQLRTTTWKGVPFDEPISVRVNGVFLKVPAGYIWAEPDIRHRVTERPSIAFQFWMPDLRWPELAPHSYSGFRPQEKGRPAPAPGAYVVNVISLRPTKLDDPTYTSPEKQFQNLVSRPGLSFYSFERESFGLTRFWQHNRSARDPEPFLNYRTIEGADPVGLFWCTAPHLEPGHPSCQGEVYLASAGIGVRLHFPRDALPEWQSLLKGVQHLFAAWQMAAQPR